MNIMVRFLVTVTLLGLAWPAQASQHGLSYVETADGRQSRHTRELVQWTHSRLVFNKPLERLAVGQDSTLQIEVLGNNEALALAKSVGRTSVMAWYADDTSESFVFSVVEDLSVLKQALHDIHPDVRLTLAPDRAALVLRGSVPTMDFRIAAEVAARNYLNAGGDADATNGVIMQAAGRSLAADTSTGFSLQAADATQRSGVARSAVINLIQVAELPLTMPEKVKAAIDQLGGQAVTVSRIQQGTVPDDTKDTLLMSGQVQTQVDLVRIMSLAARLFTGEISTAENSGLSAIANESGGLVSEQKSNTSSGGFGGGGSDVLDGNFIDQNGINSNIGRAKLVSAAGGRLLSTVEVRDLPQVRVAVQIHEVNRRQLRQWQPDFTLITNGYDAGNGAFGLLGASGRAQGADKVENALQVIGGALTNNLQVGGGEVAFDLLFSLLEEQGISRTMARPNLTVLSGESAVFRAGGEVPVPTAFAPAGVSSGDTSGGVFSGTQFKSFGVELGVRALVDEHDRITLDLNPTISLPDTLLTQEIAGTTGSALNTAAFNVRSLSTSTRLRDGQALIIGGLVNRDITDNMNFIPGVSSVPVLGKLAEQTFESDNARELIIIVTPTIVREARHEAGNWQFAGTSELLPQH